MNFRKLVDLSGLSKSRETPTREETPQVVVEEKRDESNEKLDLIIQMIQNINNKEEESYYDDEDKPLHTVLDDDDCQYLIEYMLDLHENVFPDKGLSNDLKPEFLWNIPKPVITLSKRFSDYGYSNMINPLFWLYVFCVDIDEVSFLKILKQCLENFDNEAYTQMHDIIQTHEGESSNEK